MSEITTTTGLDLNDKPSYKATAIQKFIKAQKLTTNIHGKDWVNLEGWQYCGLQYGVIPVVTEVEQLPTPEGEFKFRAVCELRHAATDRLAGRGFAVCTNREKGKTAFSEHAVQSMAQTRAVSKAYRNTFGFIMKMAGYEPTPAEEMDGSQQAEASRAKVYDAELFCETCSDVKELAEYWSGLPLEVKEVVEEKFRKKGNELKAAK